MAKIKSAYSSFDYNPERMSVLWDAFKHVEDRAFLRASRNLIASHRSPPLADEFAKYLAEAAEELRQESLAESRASAKQFFEGGYRNQTPECTYTDKHIKFIIHQMKRRMTHDMGDQEYTEWHRLLGDPAATREYIDAHHAEQKIIAEENAALTLP